MKTQLWIDFQDIRDNGSLEISETSFRMFSNSILLPDEFEVVTLISPENVSMQSIVTGREKGVINFSVFPETMRSPYAPDAHPALLVGYFSVNFTQDSSSTRHEVSIATGNANENSSNLALN